MLALCTNATEHNATSAPFSWIMTHSKKTSSSSQRTDGPASSFQPFNKYQSLQICFKYRLQSSWSLFIAGNKNDHQDDDDDVRSETVTSSLSFDSFICVGSHPKNKKN